MNLTDNRDTELDASEALNNYQNWITARTDSSAPNKLTEDRIELEGPVATTKQAALSPASAKRKRDQEWEDIWRMERMLNLSADSRLSLVTETDVDSDCESEFELPLNQSTR